MKSYILSFTPSLGQTAKYALALMQQQSVWNKNKGLVQFLPWGRYYAEVLPDSKEGVKVSKRSHAFQAEKFGSKVAKTTEKLPEHYEASFTMQRDAEQPKYAASATTINNAIAPENLTGALQRHIVGLIENHMQGKNVYEGNYNELDKAARVFVAHEVDEIIAEQAAIIRASVLENTTPLKVIQKPLDMLIEQTSRLNTIRYGDILAKQLEGTMRTSIAEIQQAIEGSVFSKGEAFLMSAELMGNALAMYTGYNVEIDQGMATLEDSSIMYNEYGEVSSFTDSTLNASEQGTMLSSVDSAVVQHDLLNVGGATEADLTKMEYTGSATQEDAVVNEGERGVTSLSNESTIFDAVAKATIAQSDEATILPRTDTAKQLPQWALGDILPHPLGGSMEQGIMDALIAPDVGGWEVTRTAGDAPVMVAEYGSVTASQEGDVQRETGATAMAEIAVEQTERAVPIAPANVGATEKAAAVSSTETLVDYSERAAMSSENAADALLIRSEQGGQSTENAFDSTLSGAESAVLSETTGYDAQLESDIQAAKNDNYLAEINDHSEMHPSEKGRPVFIDRLRQPTQGIRQVDISNVKHSAATTENNPTLEVENAPVTQATPLPVLDSTHISVERVVVAEHGGDPIDIVNTRSTGADSAGVANPVDVSNNHLTSSRASSNVYDVQRGSVQQMRTAQNEQPIVLNEISEMLTAQNETQIIPSALNEMQTLRTEQPITVSELGEMQTLRTEQPITLSDIETMRTLHNEQPISKSRLDSVQTTETEQHIRKSHLGSAQTTGAEQKVFIQVLEDSKPIKRAIPVSREITELVFTGQNDKYIAHDTISHMAASKNEVFTLHQELTASQTAPTDVPVDNLELSVMTSGINEKVVSNHSPDIAVIGASDTPVEQTKVVQTAPTERSDEVSYHAVDSASYNPRKKMAIEQGMDGDIEKRKEISSPSTDDLAEKKASAKLAISTTEGTVDGKKVSITLMDSDELDAQKFKKVSITDDDGAQPWKLREVTISPGGDIDTTKRQQVRLEDTADINSHKRQDIELPSPLELDIEKKRAIQVVGDIEANGATKQLTILDETANTAIKNGVPISIDTNYNAERDTRRTLDIDEPVGIIRDMRYRADDSPLGKGTLDSTLPGDKPGDDDTGTGIPGEPPPWEEDPNEKIWLIQNKHYPAWNSWSPKKTR